MTLARLLRYVGRLEEARPLLEPFRGEGEDGTGKILRAEALAELAAVLDFAGVRGEPVSLYDEALATLEAEEEWPALVDTLVGRAGYLMYEHRLQEATAALRHALALADEHDLPAAALRARFNLAGIAQARHRLVEAVDEVEQGLTLARERGDRRWEERLRAQSVGPLVVLGRWDAAVSAATALLARELESLAALAGAHLATVASARGDDEMMERCRAVAERHRDSTSVDDRAAAGVSLARHAIEHGALRDAVGLARPVMDAITAAELIAEAHAICVDAALTLGDEALMAELEAFVSALPPVRAAPLLRAGRCRLAAEQAHRRGDSQATQALEEEALALLRSVGARPLVARVLLERARRREDAPALDEARAIYADLGATRWLARLEEREEVPV